MGAPTFTNGTNGQQVDADIDQLYSWMPGPQPTPAPCPEATFSLTLRGTLDGIEALFTVRGMTATEFKANLEAVRGLLDEPQPQPQPQERGEGWCQIHNTPMRLNDKNGRQWWSHKTADGQWCKGHRGR